MRSYTCSEIGMLLGAGIGGCLAVAGYLLTDEVIFFGTAVITTVIGIMFGKMIDKNLVDRKK